MTASAGASGPPAITVERPGPVSLVRDQAAYAAREMWRSRAMLVIVFVLPLTWLVLVGIVAGNDAVDEARGIRVMQFVTPLAAVMGILFAAYPPVANSLALAREQRILKRLGGTPLPAWAYLLGRTVGATIVALAAVALALLVGVLAYDVQVVWRTLPATIVTIAAGIVSLAMLGLAVGALAPSAAVAQAFAMASAVGVTFLSGMFMIGSEPPAVLDAIAGFLPVQPLADALQEQFNPLATGSGWDLRALALMGAWGLAGLLVAAWALRREPAAAGPARTMAAATAAADQPTSASTGTGRASALALLLDQAAWATRAALRDPGVIVFSVGLPLGLYALMATMYGGSDLRPAGMPFEYYFACSMSVYGIAVTAYINLPEAVATARERGVLKRLRGTPLAPWQYLAGRTASAAWIGLATAALVLATGVVLFGVRLGGLEGLLLGVAVLLLGTMTLAACGYALVAVLPSAKAVPAVSLGTLLPLCFVSDIFVVGGMPDWAAAIGSLFPLKPFVHALAGALDPAGLAIAPTDLAVMTAWLVTATAVAVRWFDWEPRR
ncbi:MAG: ABC transporter permease [Chloroflexi bacterium]|nr:ABC transporter permease [Chloroflexota bacterium]